MGKSRENPLKKLMYAAIRSGEHTVCALVKGERIVRYVLTARLHSFEMCMNASFSSKRIGWLLLPFLRVGRRLKDSIFFSHTEQLPSLVERCAANPSSFDLPINNDKNFI